MPQIQYKLQRTLTFTIPDPLDAQSVEVEGSRDYLSFTIHNIDVTPTLKVEVCLDGEHWGELRTIDFVADSTPHVAAGKVITFSLHAPAIGGIRLTTSGNVTGAGTAVVSMYNRAFPQTGR